MIRPPTQIPGGAGGTNTSDDVGGIALVVLTETLRQKGTVARNATGEGNLLAVIQDECLTGTEDHRLRKASGCRRILKFTGNNVWLERCIWRES